MAGSMEAPPTPPRPPIEWDTPLHQPLNFQLSEQDILRAGEALLATGSYTAIRLIKYTEKTTCNGCGKARQARECAVLRNDDTGEQFYIGMNCMGRLYKEQAAQVRKHAAAVGSARRTLLARLKLKDVTSIEEAIERVSAFAAAHLPHPDPHLRALRGIDTLTPTKDDQNLIVSVQNLALYHREWQDDPDHARRRWNALRTHPMLFHLQGRERQHVSQACIRATNSRNHLPEDEVQSLNNWLRRASTWTPPFRQLVAPEQYGDAGQYEVALRGALEELAQSGEHRRVYWRTPSITHPTQVVSARAGEAYAVVALEEQHAKQFRAAIKRESTYQQNFRGVLVADGPSGVHQEADTYRRVGHLDREEDEATATDLLRRGRSFPYVTLAWTLVEHHTPTYTAWQQWGRDRLEQYL